LSVPTLDVDVLHEDEARLPTGRRVTELFDGVLAVSQPEEAEVHGASLDFIEVHAADRAVLGGGIIFPEPGVQAGVEDGQGILDSASLLPEFLHRAADEDADPFIRLHRISTPE